MADKTRDLIRSRLSKLNNINHSNNSTSSSERSSESSSEHSSEHSSDSDKSHSDENSDENKVEEIQGGEGQPQVGIFESNVTKMTEEVTFDQNDDITSSLKDQALQEELTADREELTADKGGGEEEDVDYNYAGDVHNGKYDQQLVDAIQQNRVDVRQLFSGVSYTHVNSIFHRLADKVGLPSDDDAIAFVIYRNLQFNRHNIRNAIQLSEFIAQPKADGDSSSIISTTSRAQVQFPSLQYRRDYRGVVLKFAQRYQIKIHPIIPQRPPTFTDRQNHSSSHCMSQPITSNQIKKEQLQLEHTRIINTNERYEESDDTSPESFQESNTMHMFTINLSEVIKENNKSKLGKNSGMNEPKIVSKNVPQNVNYTGIKSNIASKNVPKNAKYTKIDTKIVNKNVPKNGKYTKIETKIGNMKVPKNVNDPKIEPEIVTKNVPKNVNDPKIEPKIVKKIEPKIITKNVPKKDNKEDSKIDSSMKTKPQSTKAKTVAAEPLSSSQSIGTPVKPEPVKERPWVNMEISEMIVPQELEKAAIRGKNIPITCPRCNYTGTTNVLLKPSNFPSVLAMLVSTVSKGTQLGKQAHHYCAQCNYILFITERNLLEPNKIEYTHFNYDLILPSTYMKKALSHAIPVPSSPTSKPSSPTSPLSVTTSAPTLSASIRVN